MKREFRVPKHIMDGAIIIRPNIPGCFLKVGMTVSSNYQPSCLAAYLAGPELLVTEACYRDHFLN